MYVNYEIFFEFMSTLRVETFAGRNFRGFFWQNRERYFREKILNCVNRESLFLLNAKFSKIRKKLHQNKENCVKIDALRESLFPRNILGLRNRESFSEPRRFLPAKVSTLKVYE